MFFSHGRGDEVKNSVRYQHGHITSGYQTCHPGGYIFHRLQGAVVVLTAVSRASSARWVAARPSLRIADGISVKFASNFPICPKS